MARTQFTPVVEKLTPRQVTGYEYLARGAGGWFVTDSMMPVPKYLVLFQKLDAALRHCLQTANLQQCPAYVLGPCRCDWRDCTSNPQNCGAPPAGTVRPRHRCGCRKPCGCVKVGKYRARRVAAVMPDGRVFFRSRGGLYKQINAPCNGSMQCSPRGWGKPVRFPTNPTWHCSDFGQPCLDEQGVPVVYVDPGGLRARYDWERRPEGETQVQSVDAKWFQHLLMVSHGAGDDGM